jgi:hypothetical protein
MGKQSRKWSESNEEKWKGKSACYKLKRQERINGQNKAKKFGKVNDKGGENKERKDFSYLERENTKLLPVTCAINAAFVKMGT